MLRSVGLAATSAFVLAPAAAVAAPSAWHFNFNQGTAEYAVGDFRDGHDTLALYCAEGGVRPGSVSLVLHRAGATPPAGTAATFSTDAGRVTIALDGDGSADWPSLAAAAPFRTLWRMLVSGKRLQIAYGPGALISFPLAGAARLLGPKPCPKQLAD